MRFLCALVALEVAVYGTPIIGLNNANDLHGYLIVLKEGISDASFNSHIASTKEDLRTKAASAFDVGGFRGYSIQATKAEAAALADNDDVCTSYLSSKTRLCRLDHLEK